MASDMIVCMCGDVWQVEIGDGGQNRETPSPTFGDSSVPPPRTHTLSLSLAMTDLSGMQQAAPEASPARKRGRPLGSGRLIPV